MKLNKLSNNFQIISLRNEKYRYIRCIIGFSFMLGGSDNYLYENITWIYI